MFSGIVAGSVAGIARIGESDCEALRDEALFVQPVNALTSLAYVSAGVAIGAVAHRRPAPAQSLVFAGCLAAIGLGSVAFHGPQPSGARIMHDLPIVLTFVFMLSHDLNLIWPRVRPILACFAAGALAAAALSVISLDAAMVVAAGTLAGVIACEVLIWRREIRPANRRRQALTYLGMIAVLGIATLSWVAGRTDSPLCDPDSPLQPHGLWHLLSSAAFVLWWWLALGQVSTDPELAHQTGELS